MCGRVSRGNKREKKYSVQVLVTCGHNIQGAFRTNDIPNVRCKGGHEVEWTGEEISGGESIERAATYHFYADLLTP